VIGGRHEICAPDPGHGGGSLGGDGVARGESRSPGRARGANALTLIAVAIIFGLVNAVLKPIIKVLGCLFYVVTLGLIAFVVNALLFLLVSWLADLLNLPFHVDGFWTAPLGRHHRRRRQLGDQSADPRPTNAE
jgi:hypothetical protein